jgi:hypothetical protein
MNSHATERNAQTPFERALHVFVERHAGFCICALQQLADRGVTRILLQRAKVVCAIGRCFTS